MKYGLFVSIAAALLLSACGLSPRERVDPKTGKNMIESGSYMTNMGIGRGGNVQVKYDETGYFVTISSHGTYVFPGYTEATYNGKIATYKREARYGGGGITTEVGSVAISNRDFADGLKSGLEIKLSSQYASAVFEVPAEAFRQVEQVKSRTKLSGAGQ